MLTIFSCFMKKKNDLNNLETQQKTEVQAFYLMGLKASTSISTPTFE